jgi:hypothetical protein
MDKLQNQEAAGNVKGAAASITAWRRRSAIERQLPFRIGLT